MEYIKTVIYTILLTIGGGRVSLGLNICTQSAYDWRKNLCFTIRFRKNLGIGRYFKVECWSFFDTPYFLLHNDVDPVDP